MGGKAIFFEKQESLMCGQHALNMLVQDALFSAVELGHIANALDEAERRIAGYPVDFRSQNSSDSGYFSIQVMQEALKAVGLSLVSIEHPQNAGLRANPGAGRAYVCNHHEHWFTVRRFGNLWFILNSQDTGPRHITEDYLNLFFAHLLANDFSIFVVIGSLSICAADEAAARGTLRIQQSINTIEELQQALKLSEEDEFEQAIRLSAEEHDIELALKRSLEESANAASTTPVPVEGGASAQGQQPTAEEIRQRRQAFLDNMNG